MPTVLDQRTCRFCGHMNPTEPLMLMTIRSVCESCGLLTTLLVEQNDNPNQRQETVMEEPREEESSYEREGFFNEWIMRIQGHLIGKKIHTAQVWFIQNPLTR